MSDMWFFGGAVAELAAASLSFGQSLAPPVHCGTPMEWKTPVSATMSVYSFAPADPAAELPPLWRCACGSQLDGIVRSPSILSTLSR